MLTFLFCLLGTILHAETSVTINPLTVLNSEYSDYGAAISPDGEWLLFVSQRTANARQRKSDRKELLWYSQKQNGVWTEPQIVQTDFSYKYLGALTFAEDGSTVYFAATGLGKKEGDVDLFTGYFDRGKLVKVKSLDVLNSTSWDSHPFISSDGTRLYFSSDRPKGFGKEDLYVAFRDKDGTWGQPQNLGEPINSGASERAPYILGNEQALYFSSDQGMTGLDIFWSQPDPSTNAWQEPERLDDPYNTRHDEDYPRIYGMPERILFASTRDDQAKDIYDALLDQKYLPAKQGYLFGKVFDAATNQEISGSIRFLVANQETRQVSSDVGQGYYLNLPPGVYDIQVESEGYLFAAERLELRQEQLRERLEKNFYLQMITKDATVAMHNLQFDFDRDSVREDSKPALNEIADYLKRHPNLKLEISGHTDATGTEAYNQNLSERRAKSAMTYLVQQGVPAEQLTSIGFGESKPIASNETAEGRSQNRRTEFRVVE